MISQIIAARHRVEMHVIFLAPSPALLLVSKVISMSAFVSGQRNKNRSKEKKRTKKMENEREKKSVNRSEKKQQRKRRRQP